MPLYCQKFLGFDHHCSLAGCRRTGGCSTDPAQSRGICSSQIKGVWRVHQVSHYLCKHLVIATQGGNQGTTFVFVYLRQVLTVMTRTFMQWAETHKMLKIFWKRSCSICETQTSWKSHSLGKDSSFTLMLARMHSWSDITCNHKRALFPLKISQLPQKARDMPYKFCKLLVSCFS